MTPESTVSLSIVSLVVGLVIGIVSQILIWASLFFRIGRFEGTMTTRIAVLESSDSKLERELRELPSKESVSDLKVRMRELDVELTAFRTESNIAWEKHRKDHSDQHHWVANSLMAIASNQGIELPKRQRSTD